MKEDRLKQLIHEIIISAITQNQGVKGLMRIEDSAVKKIKQFALENWIPKEQHDVWCKKYSKCCCGYMNQNNKIQEMRERISREEN